jgi:hypothetical protein
LCTEPYRANPLLDSLLDVAREKLIARIKQKEPHKSGPAYTFYVDQTEVSMYGREYDVVVHAAHKHDGCLSPFAVVFWQCIQLAIYRFITWFTLILFSNPHCHVHQVDHMSICIHSTVLDRQV